MTLRLDPAATAVVAIDMHRGHLDMGAALAWPFVNDAILSARGG